VDVELDRNELLHLDDSELRFQAEARPDRADGIFATSLNSRLEGDIGTERGPTEMTEAALVTMAKLGDGDAFVVLSQLHAKRILGTIYNITRNWHDAEDVLQDAVLRAFFHLKDFQEKSSFYTWLTRIAINSALMMLRKKRIGHEIQFDGADDSGDNCPHLQVKSPAESPESRLVRKESEELLRHAILRLPLVLREVVELQQAQGYSTRELAQALGITVPAVKSRLSRARSALRTSMFQQARNPNSRVEPASMPMSLNW
jgi:RNA polymerase sigma-70 factor, ECF subfamily